MPWMTCPRVIASSQIIREWRFSHTLLATSDIEGYKSSRWAGGEAEAVCV